MVFSVATPAEKHIYILNLFYNLDSFTSMNIGNEPSSQGIFCGHCQIAVGIHWMEFVSHVKFRQLQTQR
jgi:hypothetical protein